MDVKFTWVQIHNFRLLITIWTAICSGRSWLIQKIPSPYHVAVEKIIYFSWTSYFSSRLSFSQLSLSILFSLSFLLFLSLCLSLYVSLHLYLASNKTFCQAEVKVDFSTLECSIFIEIPEKTVIILLLILVFIFYNSSEIKYPNFFLQNNEKGRQDKFFLRQDKFNV